MGLGRNCIRLLLEQHRTRPFSGAVLELGRQDIYASLDEMKEWARIHSVALRDVAASASNKPHLREKKYVDDVTAFKALGFDAVESLDVSSYEGATYVHDMNLPVPAALHAKYDLIFDGGTIEHIFDQASVFRNIGAMLKVGGRVIHVSPSSNHMDHGLYMYSPTLFFDYYWANGYEIAGSYLLQYDIFAHETTPTLVYEYVPGNMPRGVGYDARRCWAVFFVAVKTAASRNDAIPQQGCWLKAKSGNGAPPAPRGPITAPRGRVRELIDRVRDEMSPAEGLHFIGEY